MNKFSVEVIRLWESEEENIFYNKNASLLRVWYNGGIILEESDSGEPEDNTFERGYAWVKSIIEQAYRLGKNDATS